jgi:tellurite resistance protein TerC
VLLRVAFILAGVGAVRRFPWILYLFGAFLLYTGVRLLAAQGRKHALADPERNLVVRACRRFLPMTARIDGPGFFTMENGRRLATPLLAVLLLIETADFLFALDSLPGVIPRFRLLPPGLAVILVFVGAKMLAAPWVTISTTASLGVIGGILAVCLLAGKRTA